MYGSIPYAQQHTAPSPCPAQEMEEIQLAALRSELEAAQSRLQRQEGVYSALRASVAAIHQALGPQVGNMEGLDRKPWFRPSQRIVLCCFLAMWPAARLEGGGARLEGGPSCLPSLTLLCVFQCPSAVLPGCHPPVVVPLAGGCGDDLRYMHMTCVWTLTAGVSPVPPFLASGTGSRLRILGVTAGGLLGQCH